MAALIFCPEQRSLLHGSREAVWCAPPLGAPWIRASTPFEKAAFLSRLRCPFGTTDFCLRFFTKLGLVWFLMESERHATLPSLGARRGRCRLVDWPHFHIASQGRGRPEDGRGGLVASHGGGQSAPGHKVTVSHAHSLWCPKQLTTPPSKPQSHLTVTSDSNGKV